MESNKVEVTYSQISFEFKNVGCQPQILSVTYSFLFLGVSEGDN